MTAAAYAQRRDALVGALRARGPGPIRLRKDTSNLFRDRAKHAGSALDARAFGHVLGVDAAEGWVDAEGLVTYEALVDATLPHGVMPAVVPELKTITIGGGGGGGGLGGARCRGG